MPTSPRGFEWFRGPEFGYAVEQNHRLVRITVMVIGAAAIVWLVKVPMVKGRSPTWALTAGIACLVIAAAITWSVSRFGRRHLILAVDSAGITLGAGLWPYVRRQDIRVVTTLAADQPSEPVGAR
jgi:hypothetical protein